MIGRILGNFRIIEQIGMGGMATVYKAYDPDTDRYVAVKILPEHFSQDPTFRRRFEREAKAIAKLEHLHILPLFTYGEDNGTAYMVMRYLKAGSLTDRIRQGALPFAEAGRLLSQIASALDHAHANGVLHRDVKPSNVLLDADGNAFLTDFGIAKMVESSVDLTGGGILGTPAYMSPEQCRGNAELTPASDQYSLGIILYEMVTGRAPFQAETPIALIHMQLSDPLPLPRQLRGDLPEEAERVILKTLAKDPTMRYPNCNAMAAAFARAVTQAPGSAIVAPPVNDGPALVEPAAATASVVEDPTLLHKEAPSAVSPTPKRGGFPAWGWILLGLLIFGGLAGVVGLGLLLNGDDESSPVISQEDMTTETVPDLSEGQADFTGGQVDLPDDYREARPCNWKGHGPGLCIYGPYSDQTAQKILQNESLEIVASPVWSPDGEELVFSAMPAEGDPNSEFTLYRVRADGTGLTKLPQLVNDLYPDWSPDGEWLAFHSGCNLAVMHPDGSAPQTVWEHDVDWCVEAISWSPDSEAMVVSVVPGSGFRFPLQRQIWFFSLENAYLIQSTLFENEECANFNVAFSPDGEQVAYFDECRPMLIDRDGGGESEPIAGFPYHWLGSAYPRWKGQWPEYVEPGNEDAVFAFKTVEHCDDTDPPQLCARFVETDEVIEITTDLDFDYIYGMAWSPDGNRVVFDGGYDGENPDLYLINADGSDLEQLTDDSENSDVIPAWSPTGEWIAFHRNCGLWLLRPDGAEEIRLRYGEEDFCASAMGWSPDGRRLAYLNYEDMDSFPGEVWVFNLDENTDRFIFELEPGMDPWTVAWHPHGDQIAFLYGQDNEGYTLLLDPTQQRDPKPMHDDLYDELQVWMWLPDFWPQWGDSRKR